MGSTSNQAYTVMLTGSTGSLGSYLLDNLVQNQCIDKIFCLNRSESGRDKQHQDSASRSLPTEWDQDRVVFLQADLSKPKFGLEGKAYQELLGRVTHIIHNQWPVNFNWAISSFEPMIRGVRNLLDFCLAASPTHVIEFLFVSTIGTVSQVKEPVPVPERANHELVAELGGYNGSKLIAELIIDEHVRQHPGQRAVVCRLGQVAGPVLRESGMWNKQEWIPSVIASSKQLGLLPADLGIMSSLSWIPVDVASMVITDIALSETPHEPSPSLCPGSSTDSHATFYHASNPHAVKWSELVLTIGENLGIQKEKIVPWDTWVETLRRSESDFTPGFDQSRNNGTVPGEEIGIVGLKLVDFYESLRDDSSQSQATTIMPTVETKRCANISSTLASLKPVGPTWMELWLRQWAL
ncbi:putative secondary metabolism biosynthetic enzyme [Epichloe bromicola]|uniref:Secondary metabolism biosynthetic enzyme n=1 Tax=Epichloe bromicola TaxID=79588 RepID=A0ABQ0CXN7_9HYPO